MDRTMREDLERAEDSRLAPYALRAGRATRRLQIPDHGRAFDYRTAFQRDRDRIVYSRAFRRLRQKAQTGILPAYEDHRRNRLTHTLEVTQLARTVGRALRLNEDLIEAVALGHDLGQPPFGAAGALALDDLLRGRLDGRGGPGIGDAGGFDRAAQSLRVVDLLEKRYDHDGLNLTDDVREGIGKSGGRAVDEPGTRHGLPPSFEVQVVRLADAIASAVHDLDDALQAGVVDVARAERLAIVQELKNKLGSAWRGRAHRFVKANAIHRGTTHLLVTGLIVSATKNLRQWAEQHRVDDPGRFYDVRDQAVRGGEVALAPATQALLEDLEGFLERHVHRGYEGDRVRGTGRRVVLGLFAAFNADPRLLPDHALVRYRQRTSAPYLRDLDHASAERAIAARFRGHPEFVRLLADHIAGMTDPYAVEEHAKLIHIGAVPIPSAEQLRREEL